MAQLLARFPALAPLVLLVVSNVFMTIAWYGHLKFARIPLAAAILAAWGVAFFEYCFQVPANRIGYHVLTLFQLKVAQEIITLSVFVVFALLVFGQMPRWNHALSFLCLIGAAYFAFKA